MAEWVPEWTLPQARPLSFVFLPQISLYSIPHVTNKVRRVNGQIELSIPQDILMEKCQSYMRGEKPIHKMILIDDTAYSIIAQYQSEYRGFVATWGGISLQRKPHVILNDQPPGHWAGRSELEKRLLADTCELCGSREKIEVHHIRALKDLHQI